MTDRSNAVVVLDTETDGMDPAEGAALLEVAWVTLARCPSAETHRWQPAVTAQRYIEHGGVIPPEARGVHHISPADVAPGAPNCHPRARVVGELIAGETPELYYAAHNAAFDRKFLTELDRPWICTMRCAMHLYPDAPNYKNQTLRYYLGVEPDPTVIDGLAPHRALYDAAVTAEILRRMLEGHTPAQLAELTVAPVLQKRVSFGKHRGAPWAEVPKDYLRWCLRQDMEPDVLHTIRHTLGLAA